MAKDPSSLVGHSYTRNKRSKIARMSKNKVLFTIASIFLIFTLITGYTLYVNYQQAIAPINQTQKVASILIHNFTNYGANGYNNFTEYIKVEQQLTSRNITSNFPAIDLNPTIQLIGILAGALLGIYGIILVEILKDDEVRYFIGRFGIQRLVSSYFMLLIPLVLILSTLSAVIWASSIALQLNYASSVVSFIIKSNLSIYTSNPTLALAGLTTLYNSIYVAISWPYIYLFFSFEAVLLVISFYAGLKAYLSIDKIHTSK